MGSAQYQEFADEINKLSKREQKILLEANLDLVTKPEDIQNIINSWKDFEVDFKLKLDEEDLQSQVDKANDI